jgi:hypothetical protein
MSALIYGRVIERLLLVACAPLLLFIGYRLFILGVNDQIQVGANLKDSFRVKLANLSPGSFCFVLAIVIGAVAFSRPLKITDQERETLRASMDSPSPPAATRGNDQQKSSTEAGSVAARITASDEKERTRLTEFEGGKPVGVASGYRLSTDLRRGLSEVALCQLSRPGVGPQSCYASTGFNGRFNRIPIESDLAGIEAVEARLQKSPTEADIQTYANYKRVFLKGGKGQ